jgi:hypothetical protein
LRLRQIWLRAVNAMDRQACLGLCSALVLLASCQQPEPVYHVETSRVYAEDRQAVFDAVLRFLESRDIRIVGGSVESGVIRAERTSFEDAGWADCKRQWVHDISSDSPRPTRARPVDRDLDLRILLRETDAGTEVQLHPVFSEEQINPYRNLPFRAPCRSKGVLEAELLNSI